MQGRKWVLRVLVIVCAIAAPLLIASLPAPDQTYVIQASSTPSSGTGTTVSSCLDRTNIPDSEKGWTYIPEQASMLYTEDNLQWLAGRLIAQGIVDGTSCPSGGLSTNGYANACGLELAKATVYEVQNSVNQAVLDQYTSTGVPPVLLKQLIRVESQFWPSNEVTGHYGYGHVTSAGINTALQWYPDLIKEVCTQDPASCAGESLTAEELIQSMVSTCPTCQNGVDMDKAKNSVNILAKVVMAYCDQTAVLIYNATGWKSSLVVDYPTLWKLTLMNYNAGSTCAYNSMAAAFKRTNGPVDWANIKAVTYSSQCMRGIYYAEQITANNFNFPPAK
jgi:hypothetical protein